MSVYSLLTVASSLSTTFGQFGDDTCTDVMFFNFGIEPRQIGECTSEELWCDSLWACIPAMAMCPYCPSRFSKYCSSGTGFDDFVNNGQCCSDNYDMDQCMDQPPLEVATEETNCKLVSYGGRKCDCGPGCISESIEYFAQCPRCGDTKIRTGNFGEEECDPSGDLGTLKSIYKEYTLLVLPCTMGEFAILDESQNEEENADLLEVENDSDFAPEATLLGDLENEDDTVGYLDSITNFYFGPSPCYLNDGEQCSPPFQLGPNAGCWCRSGCCEGGRCVAKKNDWFGVPYCPAECRGSFGASRGTC